MDVRPARPDDLETLAEFSRALGLESEGRSADPTTVRAAIEAALTDPRKARYFVAEAEGDVVGSLFITFEWSDWTNGWYWWIQGAYVVPDRRGQGVFRALYDAVHAAARETGDVQRIRLYVEKENDAGLATYRALGMHEAPYRIFDAPVQDRPQG